MGNKPKDQKKQEKNPFWRRLEILVPVIVAIIGCIGSISAALAGQEPFASILLGSPSATPISTSTKEVFLTNTPIATEKPTNTPYPTAQTPLPPGIDWTRGCISTDWIVYPPSQIPTQEYCFDQPLPGLIFTNSNGLTIQAQNDVNTAEEYGIFTRAPQNGSIRLTLDLDLLDNAEIWIGIFSEASFESDGILMVVPYYRPANPPGSDTRKRAFAMRMMPSQTRSYLSPEFTSLDGTYHLGFDLTYGTVTMFMENVYSDTKPFAHDERWLFIGYRSLIRRSYIDVLLKDLKIKGN